MSELGEFRPRHSHHQVGAFQIHLGRLRARGSGWQERARGAKRCLAASPDTPAKCGGGGRASRSCPPALG
eukprot:643039-Alexandrium_andersonii.AAC.1